MSIKLFEIDQSLTWKSYCWIELNLLFSCPTKSTK